MSGTLHEISGTPLDLRRSSQNISGTSQNQYKDEEEDGHSEHTNPDQSIDPLKNGVSGREDISMII